MYEHYHTKSGVDLQEIYAQDDNSGVGVKRVSHSLQICEGLARVSVLVGGLCVCHRCNVERAGRPGESVERLYSNIYICALLQGDSSRSKLTSN